MKIVQVVPRVSEDASGPTHSVTALCRELHRSGHNVCLHTLRPERSEVFPFRVDYHPASSGLGRLGRSPSMWQALKEEAQAGTAIVHTHGLWMMPNVYPGLLERRKDSRVVASPRGTLDPAALQISPWRKRVMWLASQRRAIEAADLLHATSAAEVDAIRAANLRQPIALVPNGVDIPDLSDVSDVEREPVILYLGRIHEQKRLDLLLEAWAPLESSFPEWSLRIVGPPRSERLLQTLKRQTEDLGLRRVQFAPPAYGLERLREFRRGGVLVLPTATESFGMVVAEALAAGTPAIVTRGAPWLGLQEHDCGWWTGHGPAAISAALVEALDSGLGRLAEMGRHGRKWMERDFAWPDVAGRMVDAYQWIRGETQKPEWVIQ